jgi:hypothetical protein
VGQVPSSSPAVLLKAMGGLDTVSCRLSVPPMLCQFEAETRPHAGPTARHQIDTLPSCMVDLLAEGRLKIWNPANRPANHT